MARRRDRPGVTARGVHRSRGRRSEFRSDLATPADAQELAATLASNLQVEGEALAVGDASLLATVDHGRRLPDLQAAAADGERVVPSYRFDSLHLVVVFPGGVQSGPNAGFEATGTVTETVYRTGGALKTRLERPCCAGSATGAG